MKVNVEQDDCIGCELCVTNCPEGFEMDGEVAKAKANPLPLEAEECARQAAEDCPTEAITVEE